MKSINWLWFPRIMCTLFVTHIPLYSQFYLKKNYSFAYFICNFSVLRALKDSAKIFVIYLPKGRNSKQMIYRREVAKNHSHGPVTSFTWCESELLSLLSLLSSTCTLINTNSTKLYKWFVIYMSMKDVHDWQVWKFPHCAMYTALVYTDTLTAWLSVTEDD